MILKHQKQQTLLQVARLEGIGLHSGKPVTLEISPASENTGIIFQRSDSLNAMPVKAHVLNVSGTDLCTTIGSGASSVSTIEHLMAALVGLGIDNAWIRVSGPEIPILDGSAQPFVEAILS